MTGLAILCPGQGGQTAGMLDLIEADADAAAVLDEAGRVLGAPPAEVARRGGPELFRNPVAQPLVCAAELAVFSALRRRLAPPRLFAGYSLGELVAHACAGTLDPLAAVRLAASRAALMDTACPEPSGLVAVRGLRLAEAERLCGELGAEVAIENGPDHVVLGARLVTLDALEDRARATGATAVRLPIGVAAHTRLLEPAVASFAAAVTAASPRDPDVPVLAGTTGAPLRRGSEVTAALSGQLARRIVWGRCLVTAAELGCTVFLELGPGAALSRMVRDELPHAQARSVSDFRSLDGIAAWVERALAD
jgi:[acyl-carrier-protein] S-malonyltransferase